MSTLVIHNPTPDDQAAVTEAVKGAIERHRCSEGTALLELLREGLKAVYAGDVPSKAKREAAEQARLAAEEAAEIAAELDLIADAAEAEAAE